MIIIEILILLVIFKILSVIKQTLLKKVFKIEISNNEMVCPESKKELCAYVLKEQISTQTVVTNDLLKVSNVKLNSSDISKKINTLDIVFTWNNSNCVDLIDFTAFLLGEDGKILEESDFIYYNSDCREKSFDMAKFGSKEKWRLKTRPMSSDGAVLGSIDDSVDEEYNVVGECMKVKLEKLRPSICQIVFCISIGGCGALSFKDVINPELVIIDKESKEALFSYVLNKSFSTETAVVIGALVNKAGVWEFQTIGQGYDGGLQTLVDLYA